MPADYEVVLKEQFVRVIFHGKQDFVTTNQAMADAAQAAKQAGIKSVMFDFMETVAQNRGHTARAFRREDEAVKWLTSVDQG